MREYDLLMEVREKTIDLKKVAERAQIDKDLLETEKDLTQELYSELQSKVSESLIVEATIFLRFAVNF